jgi:hypothetical protein
MVPNRFFSHDGPIVASAENPGVKGPHPIDRFFSFIESIPIIGSEEIRRSVETSPVRTEKDPLIFIEGAEAVRRMAGHLEEPDLEPLAP